MYLLARQDVATADDDRYRTSDCWLLLKNATRKLEWMDSSTSARAGSGATGSTMSLRLELRGIPRQHRPLDTRPLQMPSPRSHASLVQQLPMYVPFAWTAGASGHHSIQLTRVCICVCGLADYVVVGQDSSSTGATPRVRSSAWFSSSFVGRPPQWHGVH